MPYGVIGYLMFAGPDLSENGRLVYAYITYSMMMLAYTAINVPYSSLLGSISPHSSERESVSSYRFVCAFGAQLLISAFVLPLKEMLGGGDEARGFQLTMALFAVASTLLWLYTFATTKERVQPSPTQVSNLKEELSELRRNGPWIVLVLAALFTLMNVAVRNGATIYFIQNYVENAQQSVFWRFDRTAFFFITGTGSMVVGSFFSQFLMQRFEKRTLMVLLTALNGLALGAFFFIPSDQYWTMVCVNVLGTVIVGPTPAIVWAMYADVADYGEWKFNRRSTGLVFSGALFSQKTGLAIGAGLAAILLGAFGYVAGQDQTEHAILGIRLLFSIIPASLTLMAAATIFFYGIDKKLIRQIESDLESRKSKSDV